MELIHKYFPNLSPIQIQQFEALLPLFKEWNEKINVVSRKDIDNLYLHHVLHSLAIAKFLEFKKGAKIMDLGTGGGFPGIPLAILYDDVQFTLMDSIGKKITVVKEVSEALGLKNVKAIHGRAEDIKATKFDFIVTRAVATSDKLMMWSRKSISLSHKHILPNGIIALKGGSIKDDLALLPKGEYAEFKPINDYFEEEFFKEKYVIYIQG